MITARRYRSAIDVCAGAGGLGIGIRRAGFDSHRGVEIHRSTAFWHATNVGPCDVADIQRWTPSEPVDAVFGGVPCQDYSTQGRRKGMAREALGSLFPDEQWSGGRGHLFEHLVRIGHAAKAKAIVLENVRGLGQWEGGAAIRAIDDCLTSAGYVPWWMTLDAAWFGVPQHRVRVFCVAMRSDLAVVPREPTPTHGPGRLPYVTVRDALGLRGAFGTGRKAGDSWQGMRAIDVDAPAHTIGAANSPDLLCPLDAETLAALEAAGLADRPSTTVSATADGRIARPGHKIDGDQWKGSVRLTPAQCAILQGFDPALRWPQNVKLAHRMIGNAVPPALGEAVARSVLDALDVAEDRKASQ